jgi:hypothetical protein
MMSPLASRERREEPVVVLRGEDGGIEILTEDRAYRVPRGALRDLLFYGNRVRLERDGPGPGAAVAWPGSDRGGICFLLDGMAYVIGRSRLVGVARGDQPADWLVRLGRGP